MSKYLIARLTLITGKTGETTEDIVYRFIGTIHGGDPNIESVIEELRDMMARWLLFWLKYDQVKIEIEDHVSTF